MSTTSKIKTISTDDLKNIAFEIEGQLMAYDLWQKERRVSSLLFQVTSWNPAQAYARRQQLREIEFELAMRRTREHLQGVLAHYQGVLTEAMQQEVS